MFLKNEIDFTKNTSKPLIGICFGCELIAYSYGVVLKKLDHKVKGVKKIIIEKNAVSRNNKLLKEIEVYESHGWAISELGKNLCGLAKSKYGYEIIKHKLKPIFGLQFHPEMAVDKTQGDEILKNILDKIT